jgi:diadenosine tetraphosphate (Ap4A) HIT family hydrolase
MPSQGIREGPPSYHPSMPDTCLACEINAGRERPPGGTVYEDRLWIADHGVDRLVRGYIVLKPRRHVHELADLLADEAATLGPVITMLHAAMRRALKPERIYVCSTAETVHHLHFHMLPRYADMPGLGPDLMPALFSEQRWRCTVEEAEGAAEGVRRALEADERPPD